MEKYPIGFWNYTGTGDLKKKDVIDWKDLGMSFAMSPEYNPAHSKKQDMIDILDACEENGLKAIICDSRARWYGASENPEEYRNRFTDAYEDFGRHPATIGFHIGDEPSREIDFKSCITANKIQLEIAPELTPFINFLPYWRGIEQSILHFDTFSEWAAHMANNGKFKMLCYDCYTQMNPEEEGTDRFFLNLKYYSDAAKAANLPLWTTLLSVGHYRYREPDEDDLRWQLSAAAACGCKGILWFFIYMRAPMSNYRVSAIDEFGERTRTFEPLSRVNRHFLHRFGDFFRDASLKGTWMTGKTYGGYKEFKSGEIPGVTAVESPYGNPGIISHFELDGKNYIAVVNNTPFESGAFKIIYGKEIKTVNRLGWNGFVNTKHYDGDAFYSENDGIITSGDWCAPGQMNVYQFE